jgi:hypothetical protein
MNILIWVLAIVAFLLLLPIPIKITFSYIDNKAELYLYRFKINAKKIISKVEHKKKKKPSPPKKERNMGFKEILFILNKIDCIKFKPRLKICLNLDFGLSDAFYTSLVFGYIHAVLPYIHKLLSIPFSLTIDNSKITPNFSKFSVTIKLKSIIFINIAQIIYMAIVVIKSLKYIKKKKCD